MKIGIIGAGNLGTALAKRLVLKGHEVMLSFSKDAAALANTARKFGASSGAPAEAVRFGDVVALSFPWQAVNTAIEQAGSLDGKILWDCTNALKPDFSGLAIGTTTSAGESIQQLAPRARIVKGIPPFAEVLHSDDPTLNGRPASSFVCGDDPAAKAIVQSLLEALPVTVIDAGPLQNARYVEPVGFLLVRLAYGQQLGPRIGFELIRG